MRTTLDSEDDVFAAAKELARRQSSRWGKRLWGDFARSQCPISCW
jgi:hypothetical protein